MIRFANKFQEHDALVRLARTSEFTRDFSSIMFSHDGAYSKGWIRCYQQPGAPILGFTCVRHKVTQPKTVLYFIVVAPEGRSQGVGTGLMLDLEKQSKHPIIHLNVCHRNPRARTFYERLGYSVVRDDAISGTAWELQKVIGKVT